jgi:hypothetical protein
MQVLFGYVQGRLSAPVAAATFAQGDRRFFDGNIGDRTLAEF